MYFGCEPLINYIICKSLLLFSGLSVDCFLYYHKTFLFLCNLVFIFTFVVLALGDIWSLFFYVMYESGPVSFFCV